MRFPYRAVAILGEGVTAHSVRQCLARFNCSETTTDKADIIVSSPGIPPDQYPETNIEIISEIEFAYRLFVALGTLPLLIGVTGTNGKTTVTSLLGHALECPVSGNIGQPLVDFVDPDSLVETLVVELSSYQLEGCSSFTVPLALILNITPDHLARHKTMEHYALAKSKLWHNQGEDDVLIYNDNDTLISPFLSLSHGIKQPVDDDVYYIDEHPYLKGDHNRFNCNAAILAMLALGYSEDDCIERVLSFKGVEHRLELLGDYQGKSVVNDSKSTNPDSTLKAVDAFSENIHLILGGDDKGLDYEPFIDTLLEKGCTITVYGTLGTVIKPRKEMSFIPVLSEAVAYVFSVTQPGDLILFSPGSSSFDQFKNYEERGDAFKQYVKQYEA